MTPDEAKTLTDEFLSAGRPAGKYADDFEYLWKYAGGYEHPLIPVVLQAGKYLQSAIHSDLDEPETFSALPSFLRRWANAIDDKKPAMIPAAFINLLRSTVLNCPSCRGYASKPPIVLPGWVSTDDGQCAICQPLRHWLSETYDIDLEQLC